jgi:hypothetical protein
MGDDNSYSSFPGYVQPLYHDDISYIAYQKKKKKKKSHAMPSPFDQKMCHLTLQDVVLAMCRISSLARMIRRQLAFFQSQRKVDHDGSQQAQTQ